jgi:hypothetical protein
MFKTHNIVWTAAMQKRGYTQGISLTSLGWMPACECSCRGDQQVHSHNVPNLQSLGGSCRPVEARNFLEWVTPLSSRSEMSLFLMEIISSRTRRWSIAYTTSYQNLSRLG